MIKIKNICIAVFVSVMLVACLPTGNLFEVIDHDNDLSILQRALEEAGLDQALESAEALTLFAPTNEAFINYINENNITLKDLLASEQLSDILLYHVLAGQVASNDVGAVINSGDNVIEMLSESSAAVSLSDDLYINDAQVQEADIFATNGVVHKIDKLLIPPVDKGEPTQSIVDIALANDDFSMLVTALQAADLVGALQGEGPFTVFAPTNDAFAKIPEETLNALLADTPALTGVLTQHVVPAQIGSIQAFAANGKAVDTLSGDDVSVSLQDGELIIQGAKVVVKDIYATNGVIHVIDTVITETLE